MSRDRNKALMLVAGAGAALAIRAFIRKATEYDMRGRVVLITGGSRGLGLVLARELARQGAYLAICARNEEELTRAYEDLNWRTRVLALPCDVTSQAQVEALVSAVQDHYGRVDVLINNAGVIQVGPMEVMT
ncbi:MAG TPA: SDR family NAD(P)-dependent oxidoreductase, partial [Blastocatellia bacterium]|nr:SDR family NAD(P)-dependent oxidoreductase [Blastocatellia bacterium]